MANSAAFFDLDRTLISGASAFPFGVEAWRQGLATRGDILKWTIAALSFLIAGDKGNGASVDIRGEFLARVEGASVSDLDQIGQAILPKLATRVRPESRKLVAMHHETGRDTWIVSASPHAIVEPLATSLGMTGAIGTEGEVRDGRFTGRLGGPFIYGPGKAEAIEKLASDRGYDLALSYAYSDSISDLPMMELVGHPVAVNPDSDLASIAHDRGWPVVIFARKTKRAMAVSGVATMTATAAGIGYMLGRRHGRTSTLARLTRSTLGR
ncbi:MAG TPA: HAD-IB family hydrolase [Acidimicrobiia bacterium]|nr:HAD-IB family hydrolase [Acidimicrobiia bacterium]